MDQTTDAVPGTTAAPTAPHAPSPTDAPAEPAEAAPSPRPSLGDAIAERWSRLPLAWRRAIVAVVTLRVALAVLALVFGGLLPGLKPVDVEPLAGRGFFGWEAHSPAEQGYGLIGAGLERFDALWYLAIAKDGYPSGSPEHVPGAAAFFPLYPVLVGALARVLAGTWLLAANLVSLAAAIAGLAGVHRLIEAETGDAELGGRAVTALALFPTAFYLVAPYTEGLFLACSVWSMLLARRGRWAAAGGFAVAAALTRNLGVLLVLALGLELVRQRQEGRVVPRSALPAAVLAAPLGLAAYLGFWWWRAGTPFATLTAQGGWERELSLPTITLGNAVRFGLGSPGEYPTGYHGLDLVVGVAVAAAAVWLVVRTPRPYGLYAAAHVVAWILFPFPGRPLMSTARFALAVAPLAWAFAAWTRKRAVATAWYGVSAALLGVHTLLFVNWYYVF